MSKAKISQNQKNESNKVPSNRNVLTVNKRSKSKSSSSGSSSLAPRGEPWNHEQFLKRVETFNSLKWHIRRKDVSPLLCARYGWKCVQGKNNLQCTGCGVNIQYKTNPSWSNDINNKMAATFLKNVENAHNPDCIWKNSPCDKSFELLPMDTNIMKQQLIENIKTWTQTDTNSFYIIPKIDPTTKKLMIKSIEPNGNNRNNKNGDNNWLNYSSCCDIMLLSGSGWYLSSLSSFTPCVQCRYCNKCISLQSYDYKKMLSLLPENFGKTNLNNSFLNAINEDSEQDQDDNEEEKKMELDDNVNRNKNMNRNDDEDEEMEEDISTVLNREFSINDPDSIMNRFTKLGLKIDSNITRDHHCQVYETNILQKQAHFNNDPNDPNSTNSSSISSTLSLSSSPSPFRSNFGMSSGFGSFGNYNNSMQMGSQCMRWPKQSILTQPNSRLMSSSPKSNNKNKNKNRKRRRDQMSMEPEEESLSLPFENDTEQQPRKKMRISSSNNTLNTNDKKENEDDDKRQQQKPRKNRKRKTMETDFEDDSSLNLNKRRRLDSNLTSNNVSSTASSVSTTVSLPSSTDIKQTKKSRKRKFDDVFEDEDHNDIDEDEDDDIKSEAADQMTDICLMKPRTKRARLDTPTVRTQMYFDPIKLHNQHCPFLLQHKYQQNGDVNGWNYCLKLLPNDIMYIKQLIEDQQENKTNQAKSRI